MTKRSALFVSAAGILATGCGGDNAKAAIDAASGIDAAPAVDAQAIDAPPGPSALATLALTTPDGSYYNAPITLGGQMFHMDVDTGSTTTAVAGSTCTKCTGLTPLYTPGASATSLMHPVSTSYEDGSRWQGTAYSDLATFGQGTATVTLEFADISTQRGFFDDSNSSQGILGLGPPELLEDYTTAMLDRLAIAGEVPTVAFEMCPTEGTMWVGGFDATKASGAMQYTPMLPINGNNPWYAVDVSDIGLGGTSLGLTAAQVGGPVVDTGTSLTYLPLAVENKLLAAANAAPDYATVLGAPLSQDGTDGSGCVPAVNGATAAQVDAVMPPMSMTFPTGTGTDTFTLSVPATQSYLYDGGDGTFCMGIYDDGGDGSLIGDATFRGFVSVFDVGQHRMGFAVDTGCAEAAKREKRAPVPRRIHEHNHHRPHRAKK